MAKKSTKKAKKRTSARVKDGANINRPYGLPGRYYHDPTQRDLMDREMAEFNKRTRGLHARDRYFLIADYLQKLIVLSNQDRLICTRLLSRTDSEAVALVKLLSDRQINATRINSLSRDLLTAWEEGRRYYMSYKPQTHYSQRKLKRMIEDRGYDDVKKFVADCCCVQEETARQKIRTGTFSREDIARIAERLILTPEETLDLFFKA